MIPAPQLCDLSEHKEKHPSALCSILFAPLFSSVGREGVVPRLTYLDVRSGPYIHFYCAGYMQGRRKDRFPDMEIGDLPPPWSFSQTKFANFVDELQGATTWTYSGEADLILLNRQVDFDECVTFNIEQMKKDEAIGGSSELFEAIIRYAQNDPQGNPSDFSDRQFPATFGSALIAALPDYLKVGWKVGRHYAIRSLAK